MGHRAHGVGFGFTRNPNRGRGRLQGLLCRAQNHGLECRDPMTPLPGTSPCHKLGIGPK